MFIGVGFKGCFMYLNEQEEGEENYLPKNYISIKNSRFLIEDNEKHFIYLTNSSVSINMTNVIVKISNNFL